MGDDPSEHQLCVARSNGSTQEVVVWHALSNDAKLKLEELTDRYNASQSGVTVRLETRGNYVETLRALADVSPSERPDAVLADQKSVRTLFDSDLTIPPQECSADGLPPFDDLLPVIEATYSLDGELLATPYNVSTPVLMFDPAKMRRAGLDPADPPSTLEELSAANEAVVASEAAPYGLVAWDGYGPWFVTQYNSRRGELSGSPANGRTGDPVDLVDFTTEEIVASFDWLRNEVQTGRAVWIGGNPSGIDDLLKGVDPAEGAAFTFNTSGAIGDLTRVLEAGTFPGVELGVAPLPGPGEGALVGGGAFWLLNSGNPERVGAAFDFVSWLLQPLQHDEFTTYTGYAPVRRSALDEPALVAAWDLNPALRVGYDQLVDLPGDATRAGPAWGAGDEVDRILYETMTAVIEGGDTRSELARATSQTNELLKQYNVGIADD